MKGSPQTYIMYCTATILANWLYQFFIDPSFIISKRLPDAFHQDLCNLNTRPELESETKCKSYLTMSNEFLTLFIGKTQGREKAKLRYA
ncbi:hypothetical protein U3516DRAFT_740798 [Neocallimastix sp. 'constans']